MPDPSRPTQPSQTNGPGSASGGSAKVSQSAVPPAAVQPPGSTRTAGFGSSRSFPQALPESFDLRSLQMFSALPIAEISALERASALLNFPAGTSLGSFKGYVLVVVAGEVESLLTDAAGQPLSLGVQGAGFHLGALSTLVPEHSDDQKVSLSAVSPVQALVIPSEVFDPIVHRNPAASREFARQLALHIRNTTRIAKTAVDVTTDAEAAKPNTLADRAADRLTRWVGSWRFIGWSLIVTSGWMLTNSVPALRFIRFDEPPFVGLNTAFSLLSAFTGSIILISQNFGNKMDRSVVRVIQRMVIGIQSGVAQLQRGQRQTHRRLDSMETRLRALESPAVESAPDNSATPSPEGGAASTKPAPGDLPPPQMH